MSDLNDDLLSYELAEGEDPALLNEDDLLLSDDESGIKLEQHEEEFLLSESEDWVAKQLAAKEKEAAQRLSKKVSDLTPPTTTTPTVVHASKENAAQVQPRKVTNVKRIPPSQQRSASPKEQTPSIPEVKKEIIRTEIAPPASAPAHQELDAIVKEEAPSSQETILPASTESESGRDTTTDISSVSGSSLVPESASGTSLFTESSSVSQTDLDITPARQSTHREEETDGVSSQDSRVADAEASKVSLNEKAKSSSQLCDTTSTEDVLDLYVTNQDREQDFSYDTDESTEKRDWKHETSNKNSSASHQSQQPLRPHSNRPNNFKHSGDSSGSSSGEQHFPPLGMLPHPGGPGGYGPGPFRGGMRPRFPPRPGFPGDMNNYRNNRMNFPMGGRPPFPPRGPPFDPMMRPGMMRPGDRMPFDPMRGGPRMGPGGPMFRPGGPGGPLPGGPPFGPMGGPGRGPEMPPGGPPGPMGAIQPHPPPLLGFDTAPLAATTPAVPVISAPVLPRKVLINPNFKGGVEAATNQLMRDALSSQQFLANINSRPVSDEELLRQQEEFINKNRIEVEKRRFERSPSRERERERERDRDRDRERDRERERERERDRDRDRERERDRGRSRERERERDKERDREHRDRSPRERSRSPRRHRAGSRDRDANRPPRRNFPSRRQGSRDRDDDSRYPKRRKSGDYGDNPRGNSDRKDDDEDPEIRAYRMEIEKQKAAREKIIRDKEMRRKQAAEENKKPRTSDRKSEEPPAKYTPIVVTEKKIISLKKKSESDSKSPSDRHSSSNHATSSSRKPAAQSVESSKKAPPSSANTTTTTSSSDNDSSKLTSSAPPLSPGSPKRKVIDNRDELDLFLDEYEEELLREPTPSPPREKPPPPVSSNRDSGREGRDSGRDGRGDGRDNRDHRSGFGSGSRRIVLKPVSGSDSRQSDKDKAPPAKKSRVFDRLDKRIGVNDADKRKLQRLVKDN
ncbi:serine/arginine repetitive matrix protein 2-like [Armigeres subalbatus]|uniref:serine/arginine repetitive matrix protein 2-like n=1 Tax=Armigeres subalbatus TaxID=124917 RepID=UPI002ED5B691